MRTMGPSSARRSRSFFGLFTSFLLDAARPLITPRGGGQCDGRAARAGPDDGLASEARVGRRAEAGEQGALGVVGRLEQVSAFEHGDATGRAGRAAARERD